MTNAVKRSCRSLKYVFLLCFFLIILDFQLYLATTPPAKPTTVRKAGTESTGTYSIKRANASKSPSTKRMGSSRNEHNDEQEEGDEEWEEITRNPNFKTLEFKPVGNEIPNPWESYMKKFNIPKVHGSGVYVDLGKTAMYKNVDYRMPSGRCPVFGKVIEFQNGVDFLSPVNDPDRPAFGFPFTGNSAVRIKTSRGRLNPLKNEKGLSLSPVTLSQLYDYKYEGDELYMCASYVNELVMAGDEHSTYKYPFAYDYTTKTCHIVFSALQSIQGPNLCLNGKINGLSTSWLPCIRPIKDLEQNMVYGSTFIHKDWKKKCPNAAVSDAVFGSWDGTACTPIPAVKLFKASTPEMCGQIVFRYSASDSPKGYDNDPAELTKYTKNSIRHSLDLLSKILMPKVTSAIQTSGGRGFNWANYDKINNECGLINEVPNCLIFKMNSIAFNALGSPNEDNMEKFPCEIRSLGYVTKGDPDDISGYLFSTTHHDLLPVRSGSESLKAYSCTGYYGKMEGEDSRFWEFLLSLMNPKVFIPILALLILAYVVYKVLSKRKHKEASMLSGYDQFEEANYKGWPNEAVDNNVEAENEFWENSRIRPSEATPIRIERMGY